MKKKSTITKNPTRSPKQSPSQSDKSTPPDVKEIPVQEPKIKPSQDLPGNPVSESPKKAKVRQAKQATQRKKTRVEKNETNSVFRTDSDEFNLLGLGIGEDSSFDWKGYWAMIKMKFNKIIHHKVS